MVGILASHAVMWSAQDRAISNIERSAIAKIRDARQQIDGYRVLSLKLRVISRLTNKTLSASGPLESLIGRAREVLLNKR